MNRENLKKYIWAGIVVAIAICGGVYGYHKYKLENTPMAEKAQVEFNNKLANQVATGVSLEKLQKEVDSNINKLNVDNATKAINTYIFDLYQLNSQDMAILNAIKPLMDSEAEQYKLDLTKGKEYKKLPNGIVKGFLQQIEKDHLLLRKNSSNYYVTVDMDYVLKHYEKYISTDLKEFIEFRIKEDNKSIFDIEKQTFDLDEVAKRIDSIEKSEEKYKKSPYLPQWESSKQYYYQIMFQTNHRFFLDKDNKVKPEILKSYEKYISDYKGTQLAENLSKILDVLKENPSVNEGKYVETLNNVMNETFKPSKSIEEESKTKSDDKTKVDESKSDGKSSSEENKTEDSVKEEASKSNQ
ncbi:hypothetical protein [Clostridium perfringens]|uniref:hypothetical protein n=1 Tax=Clostridium perfringens TaxID=1502 RepID=UPI0039EC39C1